ncbi:MAG: hypothetical protein Q7T18_04775 [Sedimentisphaerales bacterium]|nr:hypothetical protein [Sedimentisphaerales bacterium]
MVSDKNFTEAQIIAMFNKPVAVRLKCLTGNGHAVFDEFKFEGKTYVGGYDHCRKSYYILNSDLPRSAEQLPQSRGQIITIRTKPQAKPQIRTRPRWLELLHS